MIFCPVSVAETNKLRAPCPVVGPQRFWSCCRGRSSCIAGSSTTAEDVRVSDVLVGRQWKCPHVLAFLPPSAYVFYSPPLPPRLRDSCPTQALARGATQTPSLASGRLTGANPPCISVAHARLQWMTAQLLDGALLRSVLHTKAAAVSYPALPDVPDASRQRLQKHKVWQRGAQPAPALPETQGVRTQV